MRFERIGRYDVTAKIGEGGMGEVYRAREEQPTKLQSSWWKSSRVNCPCRTRSDATSRGRQPTGRCVVETLPLPVRARDFYPDGAADKAAIQLVEVQPCQLSVSDTKRCHIPGQATNRAMRGVNGLAAQHAGVLRWVQPGGLASVGA